MQQSYEAVIGACAKAGELDCASEFLSQATRKFGNDAAVVLPMIRVVLLSVRLDEK